jgi:hypothetical protein
MSTASYFSTGELSSLEEETTQGYEHQEVEVIGGQCGAYKALAPLSPEFAFFYKYTAFSGT